MQLGWMTRLAIAACLVGAYAIVGLTGTALAADPAVTSCDPTDVNYQLCEVTIERLDNIHAELLDVRHAAAWTVGVLLFGLVAAPLIGAVVNRRPAP